MKETNKSNVILLYINHQRKEFDQKNEDFNDKIVRKVKKQSYLKSILITRFLKNQCCCKVNSVSCLQVVHRTNKSSKWTLNNVIKWSSTTIFDVVIERSTPQLSQNERRGRKTQANLKEERKRRKFNKVNHQHKNKKKIINVTQMLLIRSGNVETNPGPHPNIPHDTEKPNKNNLVIGSYNVQGIGNYKKLKRVLNQIHKLPYKNNCIINLQETHLTNEQTLNYHWTKGSVQSKGTTASSGVAILFNTGFFDDIIHTDRDDDGRYCALTATKDGETYHFINVYAPNDHYLALKFYSYLNQKLEETLTKHPTANVTISGDFNFIFDPKVDSIGRNQTKQEQKVRDYVNAIGIRYDLVDSFRQVNTYGGFTWGRNKPVYLRSRLDHILVTKNFANRLLTSRVTSHIGESDHSLLLSEFSFECFKYGPGIARGNASLLDDPEMKKKIMSKVQNQMKEDLNDGNPHQKLDLFKYLLRKNLLEEGKNKRKHEKTALELSNIEISNLCNKLNDLLCKSTRDNLTQAEKSSIDIEIDNLRDAVDLANEPINKLKDEESKRLIFRSKAKWVEEGEKSNKYFLNLLNERQKRMQIRKIISNGKIYHTQDEISKAINKFYKNLYAKQENIKPIDTNEDLFKNLPKLNEEEKEEIGKKITLEELKVTLKTCKESAPGPDGLSYEIYKKTWDTSGPLILEAWNHSCKIKMTSQSQKESVITLLEKKGKDKTNIGNLRPISLSNCDIKLCTKTIALRTNKILYKLLGTTQTGYVPGRQVTNNLRLIEEIINKAQEDNDEYFLITLDAQKAFDSVDHNYLVKLLELYEFPKTYIEWVKIIYCKLSAKVLINGYTSMSFNIEQSVKQGDALSCALFVLAIEPLLRKLAKNKDITPIKMNGLSSNDYVEINNASYADDITGIVSNKESLQLIIDEYENFSKYSGIKLNVDKTEILILGKKDNQPRKFEIRHKESNVTLYDQESVNICGITFSNNIEISYKNNIANKIVKLERKLNIWRQRNLTIEGKILIVKTFGLSQLIYSLQSTVMREEDYKKVDDIITRFIWNINPNNSRVIGKIGRERLRQEIVDGGLKAPNIMNIDKAIKYKCLTTISQNNHPINFVYKKILEKIAFNSNSDKLILNPGGFIGSAIKTHYEIRSKIYDDLLAFGDDLDGTHKNYYSVIQNVDLMSCKYLNDHQNNMLLRLKINNINTCNDLHQEKLNNRLNYLYLDVHQIYNSLPRVWRKLLGNTRRVHNPITSETYIGTNRWKKNELVKISDITRLLNNKKGMDAIELLRKRHKIPHLVTKNPFTSLRRNIKDVKLRNLQYKMLHNIYPTMDHLFKWKIKETNMCSTCHEVETLKHAVYECQVAKDAFKKVGKVCSKMYLNGNGDEDLLKLNMCNILFGISCDTDPKSGLSYFQKVSIDCFIIMTKQLLILQREDKRIIELNTLESMFSNYKNIKKYNAKKYNLKLTFI